MHKKTDIKKSYEEAFALSTQYSLSKILLFNLQSHCCGGGGVSRSLSCFQIHYTPGIHKYKYVF